ncbi:MAG: enoyl-CoA hydratase-related protein [Myxococcota bacterium]|nr:enoyl-CoA hydratase-related protein [Myxococcota bacterium]
MSEFTLEVDGQIATLTLNRPHKKNALTLEQLASMAPLLEALQDEPEARVLLVTGAGASFCTGADLVANAEGLQAGAETARESLALFHRFLLSVWNFPGPSIAGIPGDAVGFGLDLALACDLRIASRSARFSQSFSKIALVPDGGSSLTLPRLVGSAKAFELMYLAELFGAERALGMGLLNEVVEDTDLPARLEELAARLAAGPPRAYRLMKRNLRRAMGFSMEVALDNEAEAQMQCLGSEDLKAGVAAWMQKATPVFTGR